MQFEMNDAAPTSLSKIFGQKNCVEQIKVALDSCQADSESFGHTLLVGPAGLGKSQLAKIIAYEMATTFHEVLGQSLKTTSDLNGLLLAANERDIVHLDESHLLSRENQTSLYMALDKRVIFVGSKTKNPQSILLRNFTLVLSTTDEYLLLQPLRDRMKLNLRMEFYDEPDLEKIVAHRAFVLCWGIDEKVIPQIAFRAKGTPRLALRLLQSARRVCRSLGENTITEAHLQRACKLEGLDWLGLNQTEQRYLEILLEDGETRLNVLSSRLGLPTRTVSQVVESFLLREELIVKDDKGRRVLTALGRGHITEVLKERGEQDE